MMQTSNMRYLPEDIITNILVRLPVKHLTKSKAVCKSWLALVTSQDFVELQLRHSTKSPCPEDRILVFKAEEHKGLYSANLDTRNGVEHNVKNLTVNRILGSCNGLLLCAQNDPNDRNKCAALFVVNPLTSQYKRLPLEESLLSNQPQPCCFGFGYDHITDDYKVVCFRDIGDMMVYSLKANTWKKCNKGATPAKYMFSTNNLLHWNVQSCTQSQLFCFNVTTEKWSEVALPPTNQPTQWAVQDMVVQSGRLCVIAFPGSKDDRVITGDGYVWVMKEYGVEESWAKLLNFSKYCEKVNIWDWRISPISPVEESDDDDEDEVWLISESEADPIVLWYGILGKKPIETPIFGVPRCVVRGAYTQTLVIITACPRTLAALPRSS